jgi:GT2 family glycosyltransferase
MPLDHADHTRALATLHGLAGGVVLALWDNEGECGKVTPRLNGQSLPAPVVAVTLPLVWGGSRSMMAFRRPAQPGAIEFLNGDGGIVATCAYTPPTERIPAAGLIDGLRPGDQPRVLRFLLQTCRAAFGLGSQGGFIRLCRDVLALVAPNPATLTPVMAVGEGLVLCQGKVAPGFGTVGDVILLSGKAVRHNGHRPDLGPSGKLRLMLATETRDRALRVVLLGEDSLAVRAVDLSLPRPSLLRWLETAKPTADQREYVAACQARAAATNPGSAAALREMQLLYPLPRAGITAKGKPVGADIDLAVSQDCGGLFVSGWLHDPHDLIEGLTAISATGQRIPMDTGTHRFPRADVAKSYGVDTRQAGFAAFTPLPGDPAASLQHRFELRLRSGEMLHLVAPQPPARAAEARNAVLGAIPAPHLSERALAEIVAPPAAALHARHLAGGGVAQVISFGTPAAKPTVSIVVPLYKVLDFLRFQIAALAVDREMAEHELIFVLDSPEQSAQVEHLLHGLHALYGLPFTLVVMADNMGFAAASNAGAALARGRHLLFLNSDVVPDAPGWLGVLRHALESDQRLAAVGPKLLFDDDSLQHAGLGFARDFHGAWYNMHFHKGLPRDFAPACAPALVPGVTGACLLARRPLIERVGSFCKDYIIGDYEDSDLCLRLRRDGHEIGYVPQAELYHLERQSISKHVGYTRSAAAAYNRRLHIERWADLMAELCGGVPSRPAKPARKKKAAA